MAVNSNSIGMVDVCPIIALTSEVGSSFEACSEGILDNNLSEAFILSFSSMDRL